MMLISNLAVDQRFAHGTQGRLLQWHPGATENKRRALPAYAPDLLTRFCKESSLSKIEMLPDIDHMDVGARQENLQVRGAALSFNGFVRSKNNIQNNMIDRCRVFYFQYVGSEIH